MGKKNKYNTNIRHYVVKDWGNIPLRLVKGVSGFLLVFVLLPFLVAHDCYKNHRWVWEIL